MASPGEEIAWFPLDTCVSDFMRLLHAVDTFPRGGLYSGYYAIQAAQRYECFWTMVLKTQPLGKGGAAILPPLDVAYAWLVHRQDPAGYKSAMVALGVEKPHPANAEQAFGFSVDRADRTEWKKVAGAHEQWPPPAPGSSYDVDHEVLARGRPNYAAGLANAMVHFSRLLHTWMRPHFLDSAFLQRAWGRFAKFLRLHIAYPQEVLVPAADIALIWHTYLGLSDKYAEMCARVFCELQENQPALWRPDYLTLSPNQLPAAYGKTAALYTAAYGGEPYADPYTAWIGPEVPYPLAAPGSPVAAWLSALDENPKHGEQAAAIARAAAKLGEGQPWASAVVPRAGAHALYLAWLASRRAEHYYVDATCNRCCFTSSASVHAKALSTGVAAVVSCAYFLDLPATPKHPYLKAVQVRGGLWQQQSSGAPANGAAPPPPGFSPADTERLLGPSQQHLMVGLGQLLGGGAGGSKAAAAGGGAGGTQQQVAPLWSILGAKDSSSRAQACYKSAWTLAAATNVGRMQTAYQHRKHNARDDGVYYYGTTDYYAANTLFYAYGADAYAFDDPRRNSYNGMVVVGGGYDGGGGWSGGDGGGGFSSGDGGGGFSGGDGGGGGGCGGGGGGGGCGGGGGGGGD
ncbi:hypothetical protein CHLRE_11g469800v5 [Chlamydomonas reinhardtii]|uniref:Uncharacterized protein n=1 Tax=Chlamydomonas reinhardtii TaxID=3055 RepID=A0A2K3D890_CHLRE|nr:uncharacterized protein CHLRE_11g469800v5 [Chlamydomonas reinhardtii]PNW76751.1 hypothetical protein CHLRE_11g469800v5 [Chlamydomonas reinhardtii]